jgi:hypothetical protein
LQSGEDNGVFEEAEPLRALIGGLESGQQLACYSAYLQTSDFILFYFIFIPASEPLFSPLLWLEGASAP